MLSPINASIGIFASVGDGGKNLPNDLAQIDRLLGAVGMLAFSPAAMPPRVAAIKNFQKICGIPPNGEIAPGSPTLRRLNEIAMPLKLNGIAPAAISAGGYAITFAPAAPPPPYKLFLGPSAPPGDCLDVTWFEPGPHKSLVTLKNLPALLKLIEKRGAWGPQTLPMKMFVTLNGSVISESPPQNLPCPVRPHYGATLPLVQPTQIPKMPWIADGRFFYKKFDGVDGYFFMYNHQLETDNANRGFNCTTYVGTTCGLLNPHREMSGASDELAKALGATKCTLEKPGPAPGATVKIELENTDPQNVKDFFLKNSGGYYLLWQKDHVVIAANGTVHEFSQENKGYLPTPVATWLKPYKTEKLTLRKLPGKPALAS